MAEPLKTTEALPVLPVRDPKDVEENKDLAALSYAWIMAVVLLISKKRSPFVHFHAKQGTVLFVLSIIFWVIPYANRVLELLVLFLMVWGFLAAAQGHWTELPFVGPLARGKFTFRGSWKQTVAAIVSAKNWIIDLWTHHDTKNEQGEQFSKPATSLPTGQAGNQQPSSPMPNLPTGQAGALRPTPSSLEIPPVDPNSKL